MSQAQTSLIIQMPSGADDSDYDSDCDSAAGPHLWLDSIGETHFAILQFNRRRVGIEVDSKP